MGIGPFSTYAPPGVYTRTISEPIIGQLLAGLRIPVLIGVAKETLSQTDFEIIRGSSSFADTPIYNEDASGRWVVGGTDANPTLGDQDGERTQFRVRNYPIVDGFGSGKVTFDVTKLSVTINGQQAVVSAVNGTTGMVSLLVPPGEDDVVLVTYNFHRKDTRVTDNVSAQITVGVAVLTAPQAENYIVTSGVGDKLLLTLNDTVPVSITLTAGTRTATNIANDINADNITGLQATVHVDEQGLNHVRLIASGNILIGTGNANGVFGFNPGTSTNRNKTFRVFNGPIVDGGDGGITTTDTSKVVVLVDGIQVIAKSVDGLNRGVTLPYAPFDGSRVTIEYYFNTFQDTFDYLPNSNIVSMGDVGIAPGRHDFLNGPDYIVLNENDQSKIQWGTAFQVTAGIKTGVASFDSTQIVGLLVDDKIFGVECTRFSDPVTNSVSTTKFVMPLKPTTGNGRDTPLGQSLYQTITNGRIDLPTNRPDLVTVYVGKNFRDATSRPAVTVLEVDSATNTFVLRDPVPADYLAFATFWYNRLGDDTFTLKVVTPGPSGVGKFTVSSEKNNNAPLFGVRFGTKAALPETVQWPSGVEDVPDAIHYGGTPVPETVTITFDQALEPDTHASFSNAQQEPYEIYTATRIFGGVVVDGNAPVSVNLATAFPACLLSAPIDSPGALTFDATDVLLLEVDGVILASIDLSAATDLATVVTDINNAIDADTQAHDDGTGTFASTAPNALASVLTYGSQSILKIVSRSTPSSTNGLLSNVKVLSPTSPSETDASAKIGLEPNLEATGSFNALNQPATQVGTKDAPYLITAGINDSFAFNVDGTDYSAVLPAGNSISLADVVAYINAGFAASAPAADQATLLASLVTLANEIKSDYNTHRVSTVFHGTADSTNVISSANATDLATAITLLNEAKTDFNAHGANTGGSYHQLADAINVVSAADATDLRSALILAEEIKSKYNAHLSEEGVHGYDDTANTESTANATDLTTSEALANSLKAKFNAHLTQSGVHLSNDGTNTVTAAAATDLATSITLANQIKAKFNLHIASTTFHNEADVTNPVTTANATDLPTVEALLNAIKVAFNAHLIDLESTIHVHGKNDTTNTTSSEATEIVAKIGAGINANKLVLVSRTNAVSSLIGIGTGSANSVLGFDDGATAFRHQPTAGDIAGAINSDSSFNALAVAYRTPVSGLGGFLTINSRTAGSSSTISFTAVSNTTFIPDTGIGITPGVSGDIGEDAISGYSVASSDTTNGSSGVGIPGQTYTDARTGLRFTILSASAGDYADGGSFTLLINSTFTADASIPYKAIPGIETTVYNTLNMGLDTTGIIQTFGRSGNEPQIGDIYYVSYQFAKTDLSAALFQDQKKIQAAFGPPTPEFPLSLGARLAQLNGAVLVGLKQVLKVPGTSQASVGSFTAAIDELKKPLSGNIKPDVIVPLATDPSIFGYLNQHAVVMSSPRMEGERIGIVGVAAGTNPLGVQAIAKGLASEMMVVMYPDSFVIEIQDNQGNLIDQLIDGSYTAAAMAGSTCSPSTDVATPWTRRLLVGFKRPGRFLDPTVANQVAVSGVTVLEQVDAGLRVRHGLTTLPLSPITRTPSVTLTVQFVQQSTRTALDPYIGQKFTGTLIKSAERSITSMFGRIIPDIVAKVAGISATVDEQDPTIMRTESIYVPVFPLEYIVSTLQIRIR